MAASNGGTAAPLNIILIPANSPTNQGMMYSFDPTNFNDANSPSFYSWKVEDVLAGRTPTINRIIISYRDLGIAVITVTLTGTDDAGNVISYTSQPLTIGTIGANKKIKTTLLAGTILSAQNLQLTVNREANGGPVSITKIRLEGRVETTPYG